MTTRTWTTRLLTAVALCSVLVAPAQASAAESPVGTAQSQVKGKAKVSAKLLDTKVKVNGAARIQGKVDLPVGSARGLETIVVQHLVAGAWVDVLSGSCAPNATFHLSVSFRVAAQYTLRLYYPGSTTVTAAASSTFTLTVFG